MRILISGATGFIGKPLVDKLLKNGHHITALSHNVENANKTFPAKIEILSLDVNNPESLHFRIKDFDAIINLSGANLSVKPWTKKFKELILSSRVDTTNYLVNAILKSEKKPKIFLQGSAIGIYGNRGDKEINESESCGTGFLADVVKAWEEAAKPLLSTDIRLSFLRTGVVIGKGGGIMSKLELPFKIFAGGHFGDGKQWHSWIHLEDEINAIIHILENNKSSGIYNLTAPNPLQLKDFLKEYGKVLNRPSWLPIPSFALKAFMGERAQELLLVSQKVIPERLLNEGFKFSYPEVSEAFRQIINTQ
ncbi:TIGR01777 family oxidoreductase [Bacteroidota bacterium]